MCDFMVDFRIVYDNEAEPGFESGWGFACLIEFEDEKILFDAGWDGRVLLSNMDNFGVRPEDIGRVVLSHAHWDHIGGLPYVRREDMEVYVPRSFSKHLRGELASRFDLHEVEGGQEIRNGVWTTGELENEVEEQSLAVKTDDGILILAGCSHPGVGKILSAASEFGEIYGFMGGFHDFDDYEVLEGLSLVVASHCTSHKEEISELFPEVYEEGSAGYELSL